MNGIHESTTARPPAKQNTRWFDIVLALGLLILLSPLLLILALAAWLKSGSIFQAETRIGQFRQSFKPLRFGGEVFGAQLAVLFNILKGDMAFVGPSPRTLAEDGAVTRNQEAYLALRPGLFSPQKLRSHVGIAYEQDEDLAFYQQQSMRGNLGLISRSLIALLLAGDANRPAPPTLRIFGVDLTNTTMDEAVEWLVRRAKDGPPALVAFMNPDCLNIVYRNADYRQALGLAERILPDGIGIKIACRILGLGLKANVNGTDLFPRLCERAAEDGLSIFLLGARPGIAAAAAENMQARYPGLKVAGVRDGYFQPEETAQVIEQINAAHADVLLVAFGAPKQELWLAGQHERLTPAVRLGVGGLFDFYSGRISRAPQWLREIGMEWIWRLLQEPGRMWRRYIIGNPLFLYRVWRQKQAEKIHEPAS